MQSSSPAHVSCRIGYVSLSLISACLAKDGQVRRRPRLSTAAREKVPRSRYALNLTDTMVHSLQLSYRYHGPRELAAGWHIERLRGWVGERESQAT